MGLKMKMNTCIKGKLIKFKKLKLRKGFQSINSKKSLLNIRTSCVLAKMHKLKIFLVVLTENNLHVKCLL